MGDNPVVKAGEDDGELINSRDRAWPDVLYSHCTLLIYVQCRYSFMYLSIHCYSLSWVFILNTMRPYQSIN